MHFWRNLGAYNIMHEIHIHTQVTGVVQNDGKKLTNRKIKKKELHGWKYSFMKNVNKENYVSAMLTLFVYIFTDFSMFFS